MGRVQGGKTVEVKRSEMLESYKKGQGLELERIESCGREKQKKRDGGGEKSRENLER